MKKHVLKALLFAVAFGMMPVLPVLQVQAVSENDADDDDDDDDDEEISDEESAAAKNQL